MYPSQKLRVSGKGNLSCPELRFAIFSRGQLGQQGAFDSIDCTSIISRKNYTNHVTIVLNLLIISLRAHNQNCVLFYYEYIELYTH